MKTKTLLMAAVVLMTMTACRSHYTLTSVERTRMLVDSRYDRQPDAAAAAYLQPYRQHVDSMMNPVVGHTAEYLERGIPEGLLSNLLPDIPMWAAKDYNEQPDFAVYNYGGIRAALPKGAITLGDIVEVAPFENKVCFGTLRGSDVLELFQQFCLRGPHGISHGVKLVYGPAPDYKLLQATINGKEIDPEGSYRFTTIDYLSHGNDGLTAFNKRTDFVSPQEAKDNSRELIVNYFREKERKGEIVAPQIEGRIVIEH